MYWGKKKSAVYKVSGVLTAWRGGLLSSRRVSMLFGCSGRCDSHCSLRGCTLLFNVCWWGEGNSWPIIMTRRGGFCDNGPNSGSLFTISTEWLQQECSTRAVLRAKAAPESTSVCLLCYSYTHMHREQKYWKTLNSKRNTAEIHFWEWNLSRCFR